MPRLPTLLTTVALACATAFAASASSYVLSPPDITARLRGMVTLHPSSGAPFKCKLEMVLKTRAAVGSEGEITSVKGTSQGPQCDHDVEFPDLPWFIGIASASTGQFGPFLYFGSSICTQETIQFQVNSSGLWTFPAGQCMTGSIQSYPPVTIVPNSGGSSHPSGQR
jgi:hypothetical protein